jgi:hypothetical protein
LLVTPIITAAFGGGYPGKKGDGIIEGGKFPGSGGGSPITTGVPEEEYPPGLLAGKGTVIRFPFIKGYPPPDHDLSRESVGGYGGTGGGG